MMSTNIGDTPPPAIQASNVAEERLNAAKGVVIALIIAMKNYTLYPKDHSICQNSLSNLNNHLDTFFNCYGNLKLIVEKNQLLFHKTVIHQDTSETDNLSFILFRDGIEWLEIQQDIKIWELTCFMNIINGYRVLQEGQEGDIVTALWETNLPHLKYQATDILWDNDASIDFFLPGEKETHSCGVNQQISDDKNNDVSNQQINDQEITEPDSLSMTDHSLWDLMPEEIETLNRMVLKEENQTNAEDVLDVLLIILKQQYKMEDFASILDFMRDEFGDTLEQEEFACALKFLKKIYDLNYSRDTQRPWINSLVTNFLKEISDPQILGILQNSLSIFDYPDSEQTRMMRELLILLPPSAIITLGPMLRNVESQCIERQLMGIIKTLAKKDLVFIEQLLDHPDEILVKKLIRIIGNLKGKKPNEILFKMAHHSSEQARKESVKALLDRNIKLPEHILMLIEDPNDLIRGLIIKYMRSRRDNSIEEFLHSYLANNRFQRKDDEHLLACYKALGHCGSARSVPFLKNVFLNRTITCIFGISNSSCRQGAAIALYLIDCDESRIIMEKASRSLIPGIRFAYHKAIEEYQ